MKRLVACVTRITSLLKSVFGQEKTVNNDALNFIVIDGSTIQEPGAQETTYRLHTAIDLFSLSLKEVKVTTDKIGESLDHYQLNSSDVALIDRGYNQPKTLVPVVEHGTHVVLRYNPHSMNLYQLNDEPALTKIDWEWRLRELNGQAGATPVCLSYQGKPDAGIVHAIPLPSQKPPKLAAKPKNVLAKKALSLSSWVPIFTALPTQVIDISVIADSYCVRWQVELVIKRMKSLLDVDRLRVHKDCDLAELYLHSKLLYATITQKISQRGFSGAAITMQADCSLTHWRPRQMIADEIKFAIKARFPRIQHFAGVA